MIFQELQKFITDYHRVSLAELELHFHMSEDVIRQMLHKLMRKGRVLKVPTPGKCHGCTACNPKAIEFYEWIDQQPRSFAFSQQNKAPKKRVKTLRNPENSDCQCNVELRG
ncbi:FeoC-like transcriptional regulator [[Limnothrix rosea] IAM M-220]|uniref:FeoC-like transcriptional regulator n=1 Tax=[Limnothrix rosea] IAM M-220 TaxID=454133 RepID=UPI000968434D|nr:FeoC-like transcriptional regulator [[Limnothrix rosea] IAM M-220]OKH19373.1 hypothetical protein NIES208_02330 [[Limnothrix rosea] IAM M-220]